MAISLLVTTSIGDNRDGVTTAAIDTTGADALVVVAGENDASTFIEVSDSKSNSWTEGVCTAVASPSCSIHYVLSPTVGTGHTFSCGAAGDFPAIAVFALSGVDSVSETSKADAGGTQSLVNGSLTPEADGAFVVAGLSTGGARSSVGIDQSFTIEEEIAFQSGLTYGVTAAYLIQGAQAALNPTWSWTGFVTSRAAMLSLLPVASSTPAFRTPLFSHNRRHR